MNASTTMIVYVVVGWDDTLRPNLLLSREAARVWRQENDCAKCKIRRAKLTIYGS